MIILRFLLILFLLWGPIQIMAQVDTLILLYPIDIDQLTTAKQAQIQAKVASLDSTSRYGLKVIGRADFLGKVEANQRLSERRAQRVVDFVEGQFGERIELVASVGEGEQQREAGEGDERLGIPRDRCVLLLFQSIEPEPILSAQPDTLITPKEEVTAVPIPSKPSTLDEIDQYDIGEELVLENLLFLPGRHALRRSSYPTLKKLLMVLKERPSMKIEIHGHICCYKGEKGDALDHDTGEFRLSYNRAREIFFYLISSGIDKERLAFKGFGFTKPKFYPERTEADKNRNRRVEIKILSK